MHHVDSLACPIESSPHVLGMGLNYKQHAKEASLPVPTNLVVFTKPADALAGPFETISIHPDARELLDCEGLLTVVVSRDAKDGSEEDALDYILEYAAEFNLSARDFQLRCVWRTILLRQPFDRFAAIGYTIVLAHKVPNPQALRLDQSQQCGQARDQHGRHDLDRPLDHQPPLPRYDPLQKPIDQVWHSIRSLLFLKGIFESR